MQIYQLRYALEVGRLQSFTRAAEAIPVSVASVSEAIRDLERELGVLLFERTTRRVRLTPAGQLFLDHAARIVMEIEATMRDMEAHRNARTASVVLGTTPTIVARNLPVLLESFQRAHPEVALKLVEASSSRLVHCLRSHEVDLTLHTGGPGGLPDDVEAVELDREETGIALAPGDPLGNLESVGLASLANLPMVINTPGHAMRDIALEVFQRAGVRPHIALETGFPDTLSSLVRAGFGFTIMSRARALSMGLTFVSCTPRPQDRVLALVWLRDSPLSPPAALLRDEIRDARAWLV